MHIELSPKFEAELSAVINHLGIEASISDSFNAGGETIILAADRSDIEKILEIEEDKFGSLVDPEKGTKPENFVELRNLIAEQLRDDA